MKDKIISEACIYSLGLLCAMFFTPFIGVWIVWLIVDILFFKDK